MTDKKSHDPPSAPTHYLLAWWKDKSVWVRGGLGAALFMAIVTATFQSVQWLYQDHARKKEQ